MHGQLNMVRRDCFYFVLIDCFMTATNNSWDKREIFSLHFVVRLDLLGLCKFFVRRVCAYYKTGDRENFPIFYSSKNYLVMIAIRVE